MTARRIVETVSVRRRRYAENTVQPGGEIFDKEELFWIGYIYRYWHYIREEGSRREIYAQAKARLMRDCYLGFHALDAAMAIDNLIEIDRQCERTRYLFD